MRVQIARPAGFSTAKRTEESPVRGVHRCQKDRRLSQSDGQCGRPRLHQAAE